MGVFSCSVLACGSGRFVSRRHVGPVEQRSSGQWPRDTKISSDPRSITVPRATITVPKAVLLSGAQAFSEIASID